MTSIANYVFNIDMIKLTTKQLKITKPDAVVAKHLGVTRQTVYNWRTGRSKPTLENLRRIEWLIRKNKI